jgi:hypothetical protein
VDRETAAFKSGLMAVGMVLAPPRIPMDCEGCFACGSAGDRATYGHRPDKIDPTAFQVDLCDDFSHLEFAVVIGNISDIYIYIYIYEYTS